MFYYDGNHKHNHNNEDGDNNDAYRKAISDESARALPSICSDISFFNII